uniref:Uncharacterized protein n=1 Tax=Alexandrium catenella TaxID=2925 RepID=A0A7S1QGV5_ALECA|mmetsp:Transcript_30327/g.82106  ORF Transcript_30327/g.82106 Transcript_30327/m.82106 type:complete len:399 (+) Transcript_30327:71-1267(+)
MDKSVAEVKGLSLGPTVDVFFETCLKDMPVGMIVVWSTAAIALAATLFIACSHAAQLRKAAICLQRGYYTRMVGFPVVLGLFAFFNLLCPRAWVLCHLVQGQFEAIAIGTFGTILFMLLSIESLSLYKGRSGGGENPEDTRTVQDLEELPSNAAMITEALQAQGPKKHFGAPPLGCCWRTCMREHNLTALHLLRVSLMVRQYAYACVILGAFMMWAALALNTHRAQQVYLLYTWVLKVSGLVAGYGLGILYASTKKVLRPWGTTMKFICVKGIVVMNVVQDKLLEWSIEAFHSDEGTCLVEPSHPSRLEHLVHFWNSYLTVLEALAFAWLVFKAFPAGEVRDFAGHHLDLVEVELEQFHLTGQAKGGKAKSTEEQEEEGSEEESESVEQPAAQAAVVV